MEGISPCDNTHSEKSPSLFNLKNDPLPRIRQRRNVLLFEAKDFAHQGGVAARSTKALAGFAFPLKVMAVVAWELLGEAWRHVAWRLRNYWNVVGWDILNEPAPGLDMSYAVLAKSILPPFYTLVGTRIRWSDWRDGDNRHHILFIEGPGGGADPALEKPSLNNFALAPHTYVAREKWVDCRYLSYWIHLALNKAKSWTSGTLQVPLLFGEFGADANDIAGVSFAKHTSRIMSVNGLSWAWWDYDPYFQTGPLNLVYRDSQGEKDSLVIGELRKNLLVWSGEECPNC